MEIREPMRVVHERIAVTAAQGVFPTSRREAQVVG